MKVDEVSEGGFLLPGGIILLLRRGSWFQGVIVLWVRCWGLGSE